MELFGNSIKNTNKSPEPVLSTAPLAARLRPRKLEDFVGQEHLLAKGELCRNAIDNDCFSSIIFVGPPGVGKTSLAEFIANQSDSYFSKLSAISATVADVRKILKEARERRRHQNKSTLLFLDEMHRFNKAQQDSLLEDIELGNIRFIGATTMNPQFYIIHPLISRSHIFQLKSLTEKEIATLLKKCSQNPEAFKNLKISFEKKALEFMANNCEGDARKAIGALELAVLTSENQKNKIKISFDIAQKSMQKKALNYTDDEHYDTISVFIKSMRGSDPDAAVYWLAKMLYAGEDIRFIARRIVIFASEDVGNADPRAISLAVSAMQAVEMIGMPEARIILSQAAIYCATAPKSNASYVAVETALNDVKENRLKPVPMYLRDSHSTGQNDKDGTYQYPHNNENAFVSQDYLGFEKKYYTPTDRGYEKKLKERIGYWNNLRGKQDE